ncbi:Co2+/Mg2+ efflux protein ApaG [Gilvimarinus polysaccharolyticus]|uniref:Co2+/Mg2+ efflux protein ApaG n=1 Tax=Gilvimarinus polysaccharolyticus TaxID=863921 RepID=UPI0006736A68|nr:Co2+/Mg2+ efflux protein ApaG [Gilvimarinus polysaccharolyticus]
MTDSTTDIASNIAITVDTGFLAEQSLPQQQRFVFCYTITIYNHGQQAAQLLSRHWIITDTDNQVQEVQGLGVIGKQPNIAAGDSYTYSSGAILATPAGIMEGSYEFRQADGEKFNAPIPAFALVQPSALH